jgi:integrase
VLENVALGIEPIEDSDGPIGILKVDECECLLQAARRFRPVVLPYVVLNLFCGLRVSEVVKLKPENLQVDRSFVEVPGSRLEEGAKLKIAKTRKRRIVQISDNAKEWLAGLSICPQSERWYRNQVTRLRPKAAVLLGEMRKQEKSKFPWPRNCLRHSFGSYHLAQQGNAGVTATEMGHDSTDMLFRHYRELVTKEESAKFWAIRLLDGTTKKGIVQKAP